MEYRTALTAYRDLRTAVRDLPDEFSMPLPEVVWAVYEVNAFGGDWVIRDTPAGDWKMEFAAFEALQKLAGGSGARSGEPGVWSDDERATLALLTRAAGDPHPWTQRMLATALAASGYVGRVVEGGPGYALLDRMLRSEDELARYRMIFTLAAQRPATAGATALLTAAAERTPEPAIRYAALRGQLIARWNQDDPAAARASVIQLANDTLADASAIAADRVVQVLAGTMPPAPENQTGLIEGVGFAGLSDARLDQAIIGVLAEAATSPALAGGWIDQQLLGSSDPAVTRRTLTLLGWADTPAPAVGALTRGLRGLVFGQVEEAEASPSPIVMTAAVPIGSANHAIFRMLNAGDPERRALGWAALRHFALPTGPAGSGAGTGPGATDRGQDPLSMIVSAGLGQTPTPTELVPFLDQQDESVAVAGPLLEVIERGDEAAAGQAARALRGSGRDVEALLAGPGPAERAALVGRVYERLTGETQPVAGLAASSSLGDKLTRWFAQRWTDDGLPTPAAWGREAGSREALLAAAAEPDEAAGGGAFAALTALAGGDREMQLKMIDRFKQQRVTLGREDLAAEWADAAQDVYLLRLADAAGEYALSMGVYADGPAAMAEAQGVSTAQERQDAEVTFLALAQLVADGRSVRFVNRVPELTVPDDKLALRILEPRELEDLGLSALSDLPLEGVEEPLDLLPTSPGVWRGMLVLPDGRGFELVMTRK